MNAGTAFENRKDVLRAQLEGAQGKAQAVSVAAMTLEQIACDLAQDETDDAARQRQQAVMAVAKRLPLGLRAARAEGQLVLRPAKEEQASLAQKAKLSAFGLGALMLGALAVYEAIDGKTTFALMQALGAALLCIGGRRAAPQMQQMEAQGVEAVDADALVREVGEICQAADVCASDLMLIDRECAAARLTGTADDAMLGLLASMMEARASGRDDLALRALSQAEQTLRMLGIEAVAYAPAQAAMFDVLPTLGGARTVRPALVKDGRVLRRGVAAVAAERGVGA